MLKSASTAQHLPFSSSVSHTPFKANLTAQVASKIAEKSSFSSRGGDMGLLPELFFFRGCERLCPGFLRFSSQGMPRPSLPSHYKNSNKWKEIVWETKTTQINLNSIWDYHDMDIFIRRHNTSFCLGGFQSSQFKSPPQSVSVRLFTIILSSTQMGLFLRGDRLMHIKGKPNQINTESNISFIWKSVHCKFPH